MLTAADYRREINRNKRHQGVLGPPALQQRSAWPLVDCFCAITDPQKPIGDILSACALTTSKSLPIFSQCMLEYSVPISLPFHILNACQAIADPFKLSFSERKLNPSTTPLSEHQSSTPYPLLTTTTTTPPTETAKGSSL